MLGYKNVELIGSGAFGFVFAGIDDRQQHWVFKFSRITLAQSVRDRLEDEAYMLSRFDHPMIPQFYAFERVKKQGILMMARAEGEDLEQLSIRQGKFTAKQLLNLALQLHQLLHVLRNYRGGITPMPVVHGDIKPSNLVWDERSKTLSLVDWGLCLCAAGCQWAAHCRKCDGLNVCGCN